MFPFFQNLFIPLKGVPEKNRDEVALLKVTRYEQFTTALAYLVNEWLHNRLGEGAPKEPWDTDAVMKVNQLNGDPKGSIDDMDEETRTVFDKLIEIKLPGHLKIVASHRRWICATFRFCKIVGVELSDQMANLVWRHDLSKYSHKEVIGYAIMFGDGSIDFKQLQTEQENTEWQHTLYNHYAHNPHHPEYFYPLQADGTRKRENSMKELDPVNGKHYLIESIIDMLASRGERYLSEDRVFSVTKWFDIPDKFLGRYCQADREYVVQKMDEWLQIAGHFMESAENIAMVQCLFDDRPVALDVLDDMKTIITHA